MCLATKRMLTKALIALLLAATVDRMESFTTMFQSHEDSVERNLADNRNSVIGVFPSGIDWMAGYSRSKRPLTSQVHGDPQLEEEDEYSNGLEPNLEDFAGSLKRDNVAGASENSIVDMTGVEVMGPNAAAHKQDEATREFAAGEVVDAADEAGGNVTEDLIDADAQPGQSVMMTSCGGAPQDMVPFSRVQSPWGMKKMFWGIMHQPSIAVGMRRLLLDGLTASQEPHAFGRRHKDSSMENGTISARPSSDSTEGKGALSDAPEELGLHQNRGSGEERGRAWDETRHSKVEYGPQVNATGLAGKSQVDCEGSRAPRRSLLAYKRRVVTTPREQWRINRVTSKAEKEKTQMSQMRATGCSKKMRRVNYENNGYGPKASKKNRLGDALINGCIADPALCTAAAFNAGTALPSARLFEKLPKAELGRKRYRSCALVGNAGHLINHQYGPYIDRHEAVIRFNVLGMHEFRKHVGERTTFRVLNNARSVDACCDGQLPEGKRKPIGIVLWYPAGQDEMKAKCLKKYPLSKIYTLNSKFVEQEVKAFNALRLELQKMGLGGQLGGWKQLTSGGHAVFLFSQVCDSISLYGFSTWPSTGPDQYAGRNKKTITGQKWHDWDGESLTWRLLFSAGHLQICSK